MCECVRVCMYKYVSVRIKAAKWKNPEKEETDDGNLKRGDSEKTRRRSK